MPAGPVLRDGRLDAAPVPEGPEWPRLYASGLPLRKWIRCAYLPRPWCPPQRSTRGRGAGPARVRCQDPRESANRSAGKPDPV